MTGLFKAALDEIGTLDTVNEAPVKMPIED
jgi:hypothetical protein